MRDEELGVIRKKALLRFLARREADRIGLTVSSQDMQAVIDDFRLRRGLLSSAEMNAWLQSKELTSEVFVRAIHDLAIVSRIEEIYGEDVEREIRDHMQIESAREKVTNLWLASRARGQARWMQVNVALHRHESSVLASARALFRQLSMVLADWKPGEGIDRFFFVRKPPDVRLRFLLGDKGETLPAKLESILSALMRDGFVDDYFPSVYEPETFQFGGREGTDLVHGYFEADSRAWIELDLLAAQGRRTIPTGDLVLGVMNDLFSRTLSCNSEVWDAWCNLESLVHSSREIPPTAMEALPIDSIYRRALGPEARIIRDYIRANQEISAGLQELWREGKLRCGLRALLPFIAMFHFNRHGLDAAGQAVLAEAMTRAWNPKRGLRGSEVDPIELGAVRHRGTK